MARITEQYVYVVLFPEQFVYIVQWNSFITQRLQHEKLPHLAHFSHYKQRTIMTTYHSISRNSSIIPYWCFLLR